jgi:hypothetical protein
MFKSSGPKLSYVTGYYDTFATYSSDSLGEWNARSLQQAKTTSFHISAQWSPIIHRKSSYSLRYPCAPSSRSFMCRLPQSLSGLWGQHCVCAVTTHTTIWNGMAVGWNYSDLFQNNREYPDNYGKPRGYRDSSCICGVFSRLCLMVCVHKC